MISYNNAQCNTYSCCCRAEYNSLEQGSVVSRKEACLPDGTIPSRARFEQGDACSLDVGKLGSFDAVLASNLLCRYKKKAPKCGRLNQHTIAGRVFGQMSVFLRPKYRIYFALREQITCLLGALVVRSTDETACTVTRQCDASRTHAVFRKARTRSVLPQSCFVVLFMHRKSLVEIYCKSVWTGTLLRRLQ